MPTFDSQKFPSGRSVADCRKDAKRLSREQKIPLYEAQNRVAKLNGVDMPWGLAIKKTLLATPDADQRMQRITAKDIQLIIAGHSRLTHFGIGVPLRGIRNMEEHHFAMLEGRKQLVDAVDECNRACLFLAHVDKRKTFNPKLGSSYGLKHQAQGFLRSLPGADKANCYIANGALICAAIFLGFDYKVESPESPNVQFNMSSRSPVFAWRRLKNRKPSSLYHPQEFAKLEAYEKQLGIQGVVDAKSLDAKLKLFDPKVHGGEVMSAPPVGHEIFWRTTD
jgi:hypothetical protein